MAVADLSLYATRTRAWHCDRCGIEEEAATKHNEQRWHRCRALNMDWPLVEGKARTVQMDREDYVSAERALRYANCSDRCMGCAYERAGGDPVPWTAPSHDGRPVMAVRIDRPDGSNDTTVFPGIAVGQLD